MLAPTCCMYDALYSIGCCLQKDEAKAAGAGLLMTEWTSAQQKALERAIGLVPKDLPPAERWQKIADMVQGRTAKECVARYKQIVQMMKEKKAKS